MKRVLAVCAIASLLVAVCLCDPNLRGVAKSAKKQYQDALRSGRFHCFDGRKAIPASQLNDDYCDCHDSSDEPGTSACLNGRFWCRNKFHESLFIPSSRVNDGVCDCCDGSDEYASTTKCSDVCYELGSEKRKASQESVQTYQKGLQIRAQYVERSQKELKLKTVQVEQIDSDLIVLNEQISALKAEVAELERQSEPVPETPSPTEAPSSEPAPTETQAVVDLGNAPLDSKVRVVGEDSTAKNSEPEGDFDEEDDIVSDEYEGDSDDASSDEPQPEAKEHDIKDLDEGDDNPTEGGDYEDDYYDRFDEDEINRMREEDDEDTEDTPESTGDQREGDSTGKDVITVWYSKILNLIYDLPEYVTRLIRMIVPPPPPVLTPLEQKRKELQEAESRKSDLENTRNKLQNILSKDFGADKGFFELHEKCFDYVAAQYTYSVCPYKQASQIGDSTANLGRTFSLEENASKLVFRNGDGCWQGPSRSMTVTLTCGSNEQVLKVEEPEKCVYTSVMTTPLACDSAALQALLAEIRKEQNSDDDDDDTNGSATAQR